MRAPPKVQHALRVPAGRKLTRRQFAAGVALAGAIVGAPAARTIAADRSGGDSLFSAIGITAKIQRAAELQACGADFIVESVSGFLVPDQPATAFAPMRALAAAAPLPIFGCNSFLRDPALRCVGPKADHPRVLAYAAVAFERLREIGGEYIVFGSNTARHIPDGWPRQKAEEQFIALLAAMAPLAARQNITVGVEMQRTQECNYLNHIAEVANVVAAVNHPNIRILADLFHMSVMGDTPEDLARAMSWVGVIELAEKENRTLPGVKGDNFRPYFAALARGGYRGRIDIEGDGSRAQLENAFTTVARQAQDAMRAISSGR